MDMTGEYRIPAPRETVWEGLNDPEILRQCIPGCESLDKTADNEFTARVAAKVGPVSAKFGGKVTLSDINPPESYKISGEGTGGAAGFAKGGATVSLAEEDGGTTVLTYHANAQVGGKLAQIGSRLIDATAKKMADQFFSRFAEVVGQPAAPAAAEAPPPPPPEVPPPAAEAPPEPAPATGIPAEPPPVAAPPPSKGLPPAVWIGGLVVLVIVILVILS